MAGYGKNPAWASQQPGGYGQQGQMGGYPQQSMMHQQSMGLGGMSWCPNLSYIALWGMKTILKK
jgi:hypothetical protein